MCKIEKEKKKKAEQEGCSFVVHVFVHKSMYAKVARAMHVVRGGLPVSQRDVAPTSEPVPHVYWVLSCNWISCRMCKGF